MNILIVDDHDLVREALANFLEDAGGYDVSQCPNLPSALEAIQAKRGGFDLVLLDYKMAGMQGLEGLHRAMSAAPETPVALISGEAPVEVAQEALQSGAAGFIPKTMGLRAMFNAVRHMLTGAQFAPIQWFDDEHARKSDVTASFGLTEREDQVLSGLMEGKSNKEIARDLNLQEVTVKLHLKSLYRKLGARNRTHAVLQARTNGLAL